MISNPHNRLIKDVRVRNTLPQKLMQSGYSSISEVITIYPVIDYQVKKLNDLNVEEITFPKFIPKQSIIITYMYQYDVIFTDFNIAVESDEGQAKILPYAPLYRYPNWFYIIVYVLLFIGSVVTVNFILTLIPAFGYLLKITHESLLQNNLHTILSIYYD
jgi:hypothetical protein